MTLLKSKAIAEKCGLPVKSVRNILQSDQPFVATRITYDELQSIKDLLSKEFEDQTKKLNTIMKAKQPVDESNLSEWLVVYKDYDQITRSFRIKANDSNEALTSAKSLLLGKVCDKFEMNKIQKTK